MDIEVGPSGVGKQCSVNRNSARVSTAAWTYVCVILLDRAHNNPASRSKIRAKHST